MIEIKNLRKTYDGHEALKGISFNIREGEFYGLLGPNGAGKTTTISIMSSILEPDSGEVLINGKNITGDITEAKQLTGVVPQEIALYGDFSAFENLSFWGSLYNVPNRELKQRIENMLNLFGLYDRRHDKVKAYSGGMKRRINIAAALLHQPKIVFMDEPTVGIDPQSRNLIYEVIEQLHQEGMTIVYTTHYMEEAERFCDRIGIIDNGQIIEEGTLQELKSRSNLKEVIEVTYDKLEDTQAGEIISRWPGSSRKENKISFLLTDIQKELPGIVIKSSEIGVTINNIEIQRTNLETIFLNLTGKQLRD
ncbi:MAG: ABC transporter ATP-binding protein [Chitinophagaceae bacterium]|nr:ABC transporter ATP-binding protein [Chitinophagaceae bacterium]